MKAGAVFTASSIEFAGPLCAQNNWALPPEGASVEEAGGFLRVESSTARFLEPETAFINGNSPNDIAVILINGLFCGSSSTSWPTGAYNLTGQACACDSDFQNGTKNSCDSCPFGWNATACGCKGPDCTAGQCCNAVTQSFIPAGVLCRQPTGSCDRPASCSGDSADCPDNSLPNGAHCRYSARDQYLDSIKQSGGSRHSVGKDVASPY